MIILPHMMGDRIPSFWGIRFKTKEAKPTMITPVGSPKTEAAEAVSAEASAKSKGPPVSR